MTIFAGAYNFTAGNILPFSLKESLRQNLRRADDGRDDFAVFDSPDLYLIKWDSGAFNEPAWLVSGDGALYGMVGDPLLNVDGTRLNRMEQMRLLIGPDGQIDDSVLARTRGAFSIVAFSASNRTLTLATDLIGLRSVYYTVQEGVFIFSSTLRTLEAMRDVVKIPSTAGLIESCVFGFPLAERTPYVNISLLRECQKATIPIGGGVQLTNYHDWSIAGPIPDEPAVSAQELFAKFQESIRLRLATDRRVYAFLSGGMDSRAIVSSLVTSGCEVEALNFSPHLSQDQVYARQFAETLGTQCRVSFLPRSDDPNFSMLAFKAKSEMEQLHGVNVDRPAFLWSGDGGSVGLGHVYMDETMLDLANQRNFSGALTHFLRLNGLALPVKVLASKSRDALQNLISANALLEINRYQRADLGRRLYLFLLFNDQRRHLFKHFESIDQHGLEFLLPFYDSHFLRSVADTPVSWGVFHKLYALWFENLSPSARTTPWQTYPGHQPCPIKGDDSLSYQWAGRVGDKGLPVSTRLSDGWSLAKQAFEASLPAIFSRPRLLLAAMLHGFGIRDCGHILTMLTHFRRGGSRV